MSYETGEPGDVGSITFAASAERLQENGYDVFPVRPGTKVPAVKGWQKPASPSLVKSWMQEFPGHNVGFLCGRCVAYDIDRSDPEEADRLHKLGADIFGGTPLVRFGSLSKRVLLYRAWAGAATVHYDGADILGSRSQFVGGGRHPSGQEYRWAGESPLDVHMFDLPVATPEGLEALNKCLADILGKRVRKTFSTPITPTTTSNTNLILDGRDKVLADCVYNAWATGEHDADKIAHLAFARFKTVVELKRPRRDSAEPWSLSDAHAKATYLIQSGKQRPAPGSLGLPKDGRATPHTEIEQFNKAVSEICSLGNLSRAADRISRVMATLSQTTGACFATARTLARWLDLNEDTVTHQRSRLVKEGLWTREYDGSVVGALAKFRPRIAFAIELAGGVVADATRKSSLGVNGDEKFQEINEQMRLNRTVGFESLACWSGEPA